jgi:hypothetical protein
MSPQPATQDWASREMIPRCVKFVLVANLSLNSLQAKTDTFSVVSIILIKQIQLNQLKIKITMNLYSTTYFIIKNLNILFIEMVHIKILQNIVQVCNHVSQI